MEEFTADSLNEQFGIAGQVNFRAGPGGLLVVDIANDNATAQIALQGAQVLAFQPRGAAPVLFLSDRAIYAPGKAIRGGIPVCWPWFGQHPSDTSKPPHGFVRLVTWPVVAASALEDGTTELRLELSDSPATLAQWPHPFRLTLTVQVGRELRLALDSYNLSDQPLHVTEALHSYFQIGNVTALAVRGLEGTSYSDKVAGGPSKVQQGPISIEGETDRVYLDTSETCVIEDQAQQRRIYVAKDGSQSTIVWNPWREKAQQMADFGASEYEQMICVEAGNALDNAVLIAPGAKHRLAMEIRVEAAEDENLGRS